MDQPFRIWRLPHARIMREVRDEMLTLWTRIAKRPLGAKMMAGVILVGIFSLLASPDIFDHSKAAAISLTKPVSSEAASRMDPNRDCSSSRQHPAETLP